MEVLEARLQDSSDQGLGIVSLCSHMTILASSGGMLMVSRWKWNTT